MAEEVDSLEISQLKAMVLALNNEVSVLATPVNDKGCHRVCTVLTPPSLQSQMMPGASALLLSSKANSVTRKAVNAPQQRVKSRKRTIASRTRSPLRSSKAAGYEVPKFSASQPELPTTIPDSVRTVKMSLGSGKSGDTQPLSQSIYEGLELAFKGPGGSNGSVSQKPSAIPLSGSPIQTGRLDLVGLFEQPSAIPGDDTKGHNDEDIFGVSQIDVHAELYPEAKRFQLPETPATNGKKRNFQGDIIHGAADTPLLPVNPFANHTKADVGVMGLSQVFKATQAPSSPFVGQLASDATLDRPSPDMYSVQRPSTALPHSSPAKLQRQGLHRSVTEPHDNYISREESQAERERRLRLQPTSSPVGTRKHFQDSSDDDFGPEQSQLLRRINKRRIELEASHQFDTVRAKPRPGSSNGGRALDKRPFNREGPIHMWETSKSTDNTVVISDDPQLVELDVHDSEDETEREEDSATPEIELPDELAEDDKENMEARRVQVPMTTSRTPRKNYTNVSSQPSPLKHRLRSAPIQDEIDELASDDIPRDILTPLKATTVAVTLQSIAVADSQLSPSISKLKHDSMAARHELNGHVLSTDTGAFVPQSQVHSLPHTSQIDSSMARHFLNSSSIPSDSIVTPSRTRSSPRLLHNSSPSKQINQRKSGLCSGSPNIGKGCIGSSQLASSPPDIRNLERRTRHSEHIVSKSPNTKDAIPAADGVDSHRTAESGGLSNNMDRRTFHAHQSEIRSKIEHDKATPYGKGTPKSTIPETSSVARLTVALSGSPSIRRTNILETSVSTTAPASLQEGTRKQQISNPSTLFATAKTHVSSINSHTPSQRRFSDPVRSLQKPISSKMKSFADIAADPSPPDEIGIDDIDIDPMTTEDIKFQALMEASSPIPPNRKRRKCALERKTRARKNIESHIASMQNSSPCGRTRDSEIAVASEVQTTAVSISPAELTEPNDESEEAHDDGVITDISTSLLGNFVEEIEKESEKPLAARLAQKKSTLKIRGKIKDRTIEVRELPESRDCVVPDALANTPFHGRHEGIVSAPNRVLAMFKGSFAAYYPATCIGVSGADNTKYRIRFDDGTVDIVNASLVKRFELRKGDMVKLDIPGDRSHTYVVAGLLNKQELLDDPAFTSPKSRRRTTLSTMPTYPTTDIYGHLNVMLSLKRRQSGSIPQPTVLEQTVPLAKIYLPSTLWASLKDRIFFYHLSPSSSRSGLQTPSDRPSTPSTPSSRTRRLKASARSYPTTSAPISTTRRASSLFGNVVFGLTNIVDGDTRQQTIQHIQTNGGFLLEDGFDELFDLPSISPDSPSELADHSTSTSFRLKPAYLQRGFTCLIADKHCRNQKFFQALALGIPCLATRWVRDCIAKQKLLPWEPYLLPSGDSTFLKAVRARLLPLYATASAQLSIIISHRPNFLAGCSVLLITGKGKEEQMMKAYPFIAYALGASKVSKVVSLNAAWQILAGAPVSGEEWDWVCYHEGEKSSEGVGRRQAEALLSGSSDKGRKRKQSGGVPGRGLGGRTRVVITEFVIQSLILGQLLDDE
ncbi:hypothetical protein MMC27_006979 [Xylographa pallens]|nr:hypothetical protein [Xylographa pallens]